MLKMDAAELKRAVLTVQQTRICSIYSRTSRLEGLFKYAKHYAANLYAYNCVTNFVGSNRVGLGGRPCSSSCALGRALAYVIFPFLRSPMSARRWNALPHFQRQPHHAALPFVIISHDVTAGNLCLPCCPSHTFEMPVR
jgi:hypothetical protein